jgi:NitT/TauT family transport system permease protein/taurine transport system permease protein
MVPFAVRRAIAWAGGIAAGLAAWQAVCAGGAVSPIILASPLAIVQAAAADGGQFLAAFQVTLGEIAVAILATWSLGIAAGVVAGSSALAALAISPILSSLFAIPLTVWYPLFVIWFGLGAESKVIYAVVCGFFPVALNTLAGIRLLDPRWAAFGRSIGAGRLRIYGSILLPLALPPIVAGLRIGTALVVSSVILAEMLASLDGLGFWISYHRTLFNTGHVYLGMALALVCVLLVNGGLGHVERRLGRWREGEDAHDR